MCYTPPSIFVLFYAPDIRAAPQEEYSSIPTKPFHLHEPETNRKEDDYREECSFYIIYCCILPNFVSFTKL